jgi:hypothetical protein
MSHYPLGYIFAVLGIVYIINPNLYRIGFWKKTDVAQQTFTPKQYALMMRILGAILLLLGLYFIFKK